VNGPALMFNWEPGMAAIADRMASWVKSRRSCDEEMVISDPANAAQKFRAVQVNQAGSGNQ
jgi:hypothetical protein